MRRSEARLTPHKLNDLYPGVGRHQADLVLEERLAKACWRKCSKARRSVCNSLNLEFGSQQSAITPTAST